MLCITAHTCVCDYGYDYMSGLRVCSGLTWTPPRRTKIPNNNASIQANKLHSSTFNRTAAALNDSLVLVFDNTNRSCNFKDCTHRNPLSIALSYDKGESWPFVRDLEYVASSGVFFFLQRELNTLNSRRCVLISNVDTGTAIQRARRTQIQDGLSTVILLWCKDRMVCFTCRTPTTEIRLSTSKSARRGCDREAP